MKEACSLIWTALIGLLRTRSSVAAEILVPGIRLTYCDGIRRRDRPLVAQTGRDRPLACASNGRGLAISNEGAIRCVTIVCTL